LSFRSSPDLEEAYLISSKLSRNTKVTRARRASLLSPTPESGTALSTQHSLTDEDRESLFRGARLVKFKKDRSIMIQGHRHPSIYEIKKGQCRVELFPVDRESGVVDEEADPQVLTTLESGHMFGEVSFLLGSTATASVTANEEVEVHVVDAAYLNILFVKQPALAGRYLSILHDSSFFFEKKMVLSSKFD
jgi:CRP-like cAMP-binding protein